MCRHSPTNRTPPSPPDHVGPVTSSSPLPATNRFTKTSRSRGRLCFASRTGSQVVAWLFIVAAVTDVVDGWLARRGHGVTSIGKLLDPLADKMLVATALILLLAVGRIPLWAAGMVVV